MKGLVGTEMFDAYEYARKYIKISKLMDDCIHTMRTTQRSMNITMFEFNNQMDVLYYNDYPVLDHKIAWGKEAVGYNYVTCRPIEYGIIRRMDYKDVIIVDTSTNIFYANRDDIQSDESEPYIMKYLEVDEHLFQMELLLNERFELYSILHALHMLGYDKPAYIHMHSLNILDQIIDDMEKYLENHRYNTSNKEF